MRLVPTMNTQRLVLAAGSAEELMSPNPVSINADASVHDAILLLHDRNFGAAPVIDTAGRPIGVISRADILMHDRETVTYAKRIPEYYTQHDLEMAAGESLPGNFQVESVDPTTVRDVMTPAVFSVRPETSAQNVVEQLLALNVHRLFVVGDDGVLVGVITTTDVLRHMVTVDV